jgi:hypothetical protein
MITLLALAVLAGSAPRPRLQDCDWSEAARFVEGVKGYASVALSPSRLIVGDPEANDDQGVVHAFELEDGEWRFVQTLAASDAPNAKYFGESIALEGDRLVVGARGDFSAIEGAAYVFEWKGFRWSEEQKLTGSDSSFGSSLALHGDRLLVGAPDHASQKGAVYVFDRSGTSWVESQRIDAPSSCSLFGISLALEGNRAVVGAPGSMPGAAYLFRRTGTTWLLDQTFLGFSCTGPLAVPRFGTSVAIADPWLFVGSANFPDFITDECAPLFVGYKRIGTAWNEILRVESADAFDELGTSMDLQVPRLAVCAPLRTHSGGGVVGAVDVVEFDGRIWKQTKELVMTEAPRARLGSSVSVEGPLVLVGGDTNHLVNLEPLAVLYRESLGNVFCSGDGSDSPCPCGNDSAPERGCVNSGGVGARLIACGSTSVAEDGLLLEAEDLIPNRWALLMSAGGRKSGVPFGGGLFCLDGTVTTSSARAADVSGAIVFGPGLASSGGWSAGETRFFQVAYSDPQGPCGTPINATNGLALTLTP